MRIEALSIKAVTVAIFTMVGIIAIVLSLFAGSYFRKAALDAQMNSLSRVIEVASQVMLKEVRGYTFDLGMKLGRSKQFAPALEHADKTGGHDSLEALLDDPFINGFVGFSRVNLVKLRVYSLDLELIGESSAGIGNIERPALPGLEADNDKRLLKEQVVNVMRSALACWEHDLGKTKLDLAEESRIWPVYIDKSTPTTRTLDKYLKLDSCPKNPRSQRVVDTAEFVLRQMNKKTTVGRKTLQQALDDFRSLISGMKSNAKSAAK
jgi:hypothetical protein